MAILAGLLAYCFNENNIFAVKKRQAYNCSTNSHTIHADADWLCFTSTVFSLCSGMYLASLKLTFSGSLPHREIKYYFNSDQETSKEPSSTYFQVALLVLLK